MNTSRNRNRYSRLLGHMFSLAVLVAIPLAGVTSPVTAQENVGLALSGGGALGFAHLGVILELEALGFDPAYISGTSIGSIVGALYAAGYSSEEMLAVVEAVDWNVLLFDVPFRRSMTVDAREATRRFRLSVDFDDWFPVPPMGFSAGQQVVEFLDGLLSEHAGTDDFRTMPRSLGIVATDLLTGEAVVYTGGDLKTAVRASMAVPGVFTPVFYDGRYLIDGGWTENLPVKVAREMGAEVVIAVDLFDPDRTIEELQNVPAVLEQAGIILRQQSVQENIDQADLVIRPDLRGYTPADFGRALELVERGRAAVQPHRAALVALRKRIALESPSLGSGKRAVPDGPPERYHIAAVRLELSAGRTPPPELEQVRVAFLGASLTASEVREAIYPLYDTGNYEYISYDLEQWGSPGTWQLIIYAVPHKPYDAQLQLGFGARVQLDGELNTRSLLALNYVSRLGAGDARWETDLWMTEVAQARMGVSTPLVGPVRLGLAGYLLAPPIITYDNRTVESLYLQRRAGGELTLETPVLRRALLTVGGFAERFAVERVQGQERIDEFVTQRLGVSGYLRYDTLDRALFPTRGGEADFGYRWRYDDQDRSGNSRLEYSGRRFVPLGQNVNLQLLLEGGSDLNTDLPEYEQYYTGGGELFEGYYYQELSGNHILTAGADLRITLFPLPLGVGEAMYLRFGGNVGRIWDETFDRYAVRETVAGGRLGLAFNTGFGELNVAYALNRDLRSMVYVVLGPAYTFEGNGYQW